MTNFFNMWWLFLSQPIKLTNSTPQFSTFVPIILISICFIAVLVTAGHLIYDYLEVVQAQHQIKQYQAQIKQNEQSIASNPNNLTLVSQNHFLRNKIGNRRTWITNSMFTDKTPILTLVIKTFQTYLWHSLSCTFGMVIFYVIYMLGYLGVTSLIQHFNEISPTKFITVILTLIPLLIAIKRNKPQWLKFVIVLSELILWFILILELF